MPPTVTLLGWAGIGNAWDWKLKDERLEGYTKTLFDINPLPWQHNRGGLKMVRRMLLQWSDRWLQLSEK